MSAARSLVPTQRKVPPDSQPSSATHSRKLLTIVIPLLVPDDEFSRCMASIVSAFSGDGFPEVIVVTPGQHVESVQQAYPWARVLPETFGRIYGAMNEGVRASVGEYLFFLGKDDILLPTIKIALDEVRTKRPYALFGDVYWGRKGVVSGRLSRFQLLTRNACHQGVIYSREAFDCHGPYFRKMKLQADHLLNIRIMWHRGSAGRICCLPVPLAWYSDEGLSSRVREDRVFRKLYPAVLRKYVGWWAACLLLVYRRLRGRP